MMDSKPTTDADNPDNLLRILSTVMILGLVILTIWFSLPLFKGHVYVEDDLSASQIPFYAFYQQAIEDGNSFLWTPHLYNGFYLHGEGQAGMFHPFHYVVYKLFPLQVGFMLVLLASYPFMCIGMFLFLRRWEVPPHAALFGAMLFTFVGFNLNHYIHMHFVAIFAHLPWQLFAIDVAMRTQNPKARVWAIFGSLTLTASQLLLGGPQPTYFSGLVELMYVFMILASTKNVSTLLSLGVAKALAILVAAVQLLPTLDVLRGSERSHPSLEFQLETSLHPLNALQSIGPYFFQRRVYAPMEGDQPWDAPYMGAAAAVLILLLVLRLRELGHTRKLAIGAIFLILFGALSSIGRYGFMYKLYALIPIVGEFRASARYIAITHVGMSVGAAIALAHLSSLVSRNERMPWRQIIPLLLLPVTSAAFACFILITRAIPEFEQIGFVSTLIMPTPMVLLGTVLVIVATMLVIAAGRGSRLALVCLVVFTITDIAVYSIRHKPNVHYSTWLETIQIPPAESWTKIDPDGHNMVINRATVLGYRGLFGYVSLIPVQRLDYTKELPMRIAGVEWREVRFGTSEKLNAAFERGEKWVSLPNPMSRARLLTQATVSDNPNEDIYTINIEKTALVESAMELSGNPPGTVEILEDLPGKMRLRVKTEDRQLLVITESYHEGWRARIGETELPVISAYGDFIAVIVEAGSKDIVLKFEPESYRQGRSVSLLTCGLVIILFGIAMVIANRKTAG